MAAGYWWLLADGGGRNLWCLGGAVEEWWLLIPLGAGQGWERAKTKD